MTVRVCGLRFVWVSCAIGVWVLWLVLCCCLLYLVAVLVCGLALLLCCLIASFVSCFINSVDLLASLALGLVLRFRLV